MVDPDRLSAAYETARCDLLAETSPQGHWIGQLSSSPLSTAAAITALALVERHAPTIAGRVADENRECQLSKLIIVSLRWLAKHQNADGGWGDSDRSPSNIAATMIVRAAFALTCVPAENPGILERADAYIAATGGVRGLKRRYGNDSLLSAGILTASALAGLVSWRHVPVLPFERTACSRRFWRLLRLPVESQATAALVALGQARYLHRKPHNPLARLARRLTVECSLRTLSETQPVSGGFQESPLPTSLVIIGLAGSGRPNHGVVRAGVDFLLAGVRSDGSWPSEANLAVRNTAMAVCALADSGEDLGEIGPADWLLACQRRDLQTIGADAAGSWAQSNLPGAAPHVDATSEALAALSVWGDGDSSSRAAIHAAAESGIRWLLEKQRADGGWPTSCRGLCRLPSSTSACESTALALRALVAWRHKLDTNQLTTSGARSPAAALPSAIERGFQFLQTRQSPLGCWEAVSSGSQSRAGQGNLVIGTSQVLLAFRDARRLECESVRRALAWLEDAMHADGSWGGELLCERRAAGGVHRVEETALAAEALLTCGHETSDRTAAYRSLNWLIDAVESNRHQSSAAVGLALAKLSYYEKLSPLTLSVAALGRAARRLTPRLAPHSVAHSTKT